MVTYSGTVDSIFTNFSVWGYLLIHRVGGPPGKLRCKSSSKVWFKSREATFRIVRIQRGHYEVVRILDDTRLGSFWSEPTFTSPKSRSRDLLREVARCAIQGGKTTWVGRLDLTG